MNKIQKEKQNLQHEEGELNTSKKLKRSHTDIQCDTQRAKRVLISKFMAEDLLNSDSGEEEKKC